MGRLSLNLATVRQVPLIERLAVAVKAGFDSVGLWIEEVEQHMQEDKCDIQSVRDVLDTKGLGVEEVCYAGAWQFVPRDEKKKALDRAREVFKASGRLGARCVVVALSTEEGGMGKAVDDLSDLCVVANDEGAKVAVEFQGMAKSFSTLSAAWQLVQGVGPARVRLLLDTFHFYRGGSPAADIRSIPADGIGLVHLSDCKNVPLETAKDQDRTYPGEGTVPLGSILQALKAIQYRGAFSLEILGPAAWNRGAADTAKRGFTRARAVLEEAGL